MTTADTDFIRRYGPWALIAGGSEGLGEAFARGLAAGGINLVLLARRRDVLEQVAESIRADTGVEVRSIVVDLADPSAAASIVAATDGLAVGLLMYCAGADPNYRHFLDEPIDTALSMVQRNCLTPMQLCHHYATAMVERGSGGIVLVSSGGGLVGAPNMVAYGATKAFDMVMAESLWAELHPKGIDVLGLVLGLTDTPALRRLMVQRGQLMNLDDPLPGAASAVTVAADAIANLANGPTWLAGDDVRMGFEHLGAMPRNDAVRLMVQVAKSTMGSDGKAKR